jgi:K+-transporting ATPase KdpF subunit
VPAVLFTRASHGCRLSFSHRGVLAADCRHGPWLRIPFEGIEMTWLYILGGVVSVGLLVYLVIALLQPEKFS